jgi:hypothetical protein
MMTIRPGAAASTPVYAMLRLIASRLGPMI